MTFDLLGMTNVTVTSRH